MWCYVDYPTKADFRKAFQNDPEAIFVKTRKDLDGPDACLVTVLETSNDILVVGPDQSWRERIESWQGRFPKFASDLVKRKKGRRKKRFKAQRHG